MKHIESSSMCGCESAESSTAHIYTNKIAKTRRSEKILLCIQGELERVFYVFSCVLCELTCLPDNDDDCSACLWKTKRKWKKKYIQKYRWRRLVWFVESFLVSSLSIPSNSLTRLLLALDNFLLLFCRYSSALQHLEKFSTRVSNSWKSSSTTLELFFFGFGPSEKQQIFHIFMLSLIFELLWVLTESDVSRKDVRRWWYWTSQEKHDNVCQHFSFSFFLGVLQF